MFVNRPLTTRAVVFIGLLGALSFLLMSFEFPLPFCTCLHEIRNL